nr:putative uncharacterized protein [uncultured bacterium]
MKKEKMKKNIVLVIISLGLSFQSYTMACSGFCISNTSHVLVGNNEDWKNPYTKIWFESTSQEKYGRVYFGFDDFNPQGGMNTKGLCFDGFATKFKKVKNSLGKPNYKGGNLIDYVMSTFGNVGEVKEFFEKYNLSFLENAMLFFADANGNSIIIEGDTIISKTDKYQIITNFYQSEEKGDNISCERYKLANQMLSSSKEVTIDLSKRVLAATHQEGEYPTIYSNIYDLKKGIVYLYHFHNFQDEVVIHLEEELKKGNRKIDLPSLFEKNYAFEKFKENQIK